MNTLAISQLSTLRWNLHEEAEAYASRGFTGIGLYRPKVEDFGIDQTIELLAEYSLQVTSLSWVGGFTGSDGRAFGESIADALETIDEAARLRAETLIVLAGGRNNHIRNHARRTLCKALSEICSVAQDFGVRVSLEPFHPGCGEEWSFVNDIKSTLEIIQAVGSPSLGLVLDTYHLGIEDDILNWLPEVVPYLHLVQLGDAKHSPLGEMNRCLLGTGNVPVASIMGTLLENGYEGPLEVELLGEDVEPFGYHHVLDHTRAFFDGILDSQGQPIQ